MMHLKSIGSVIYLKLDYEELKKRLGDLTQRGVAIRSDRHYQIYIRNASPSMKNMQILQ